MAWSDRPCDTGGRMARIGTVQARRIVERSGRTVPLGMHVMHLCDNPLCGEPTHLEPGTKRQNTLHDYEVGARVPRAGEAHHAAKLSEDEVRAIRRLCEQGVNQYQIAAAFGVSQHTVSKINTGRAWGHLTLAS